MMIFIIVCCFSNALTSEDNKNIIDSNTPKKFQNNDNNTDKLIVNKTGVLLPKNKTEFFLIDDDTKNEYNLKLKHNNISMLKVFSHYRVSVYGEIQSDNERESILIRKIKIVYEKIETTGKLSVRGSPRKLIFKNDDSDNDFYIVDKKQENYNIYKKEYQQYKIKIVGKYYSKNYFDRNENLIETKFLIIEDIEKLN